MGCYVVPAVAGIIHYFSGKKSKKLINRPDQKALTLLYAGGAIFGIIDHIWNGELLRFSYSDLLLGLIITLGITVFWKAYSWIAYSKTAKTKLGI